jgi:Xaa-Pro aminopeptidase
VSAEDVIWSLRGRKLPMEVEAIQAAVRQTEEILREAEAHVRPGVTAAELAARIRGLATGRGHACAWTPKICPIVTTGPSTRIGHVSPTSETITAGSLVHVDFGIRRHGYCSDLQRMWWVDVDGQGVPEPVARAFATIVRAIDASAAALKPGVAGWEVDLIARNVITAAGYDEFTHALGHQIGRSAHDGGGATLAPQWERYNETPYQPVEKGNVFTLEPSILVPDYGLIALEEDVLVTDGGCEFLSEPQRTLPVLEF